MAREVTVRLRGDVSDYSRAMRRATTDTREFSRAADRAGRPINIDADISRAKRNLGDLQNDLRQIGNRPTNVSVDADIFAAQRKLAAIESDLRDISGGTARANVDADTAAAQFKLAAVDRELDELDGRTARPNVRVDGALTASRDVSMLTSAILTLGPAAIPVTAAVSTGFLAMGSTIGAVAAGVGTTMLAFAGIGEALTAMNNAQSASAAGASQLARAQSQAAQQIADAQRRVTDARRDQARTAVQGSQQIADAERAVGDARREAASAATAASRRVEDAQDSLRAAHERVRFALEDLHDARQEAIRDLQDLREETRDNALSEEAAEIRLLEARRRLRQVNDDDKASSLDLRKARLDVAMAEDQLSDVRRKAKRDQSDLSEAERNGINGSDKVVAARRGVADAERGVKDAKQALGDAVRAAADQQRASNRAVADAERNLARTRAEVAQRNQDAAQQVSDAQRDLRRAMAQASTAMATQSSQATTLESKLAALSPAARHFAEFLFSLKPKLKELQATAASGLFPGLETGIRQLLNLFPEVQRLVGNTATALGNLAAQGGRALNSPFWRNFISFLADTAGPTLTTFGRILGNLATGFAGMMMAFNPLATDFSSALLDMSQKFAHWGATLSQNKGFKQFVSYVREVTPQVVETVKAVARAVGAIVVAAAPLGPVVLDGIRAFANTVAFIARIPGVGTALLGIAGGLAAVSRVIRVYDIARHSRIVQLITGTGAASAGAAGRVSRFSTALRGLGVAGLVVGGMVFLTRKVQGLDVATNQLTGATRRYASTGRLTGALARQWGTDTNRLGNALRMLTRRDMQHAISAMGGMRAAAQVNRQKFQQLDATLARMVRNDNAEGARQAFNRLKQETRKAGGNVSRLNRLFPQYTQALRNNKGPTTNATTAHEALVTTLRDERSTANQVRSAFDRLTGAHQRSKQAEIDYQAALDSATASARRNGRTINTNTRRGRENFQTLLDLARAGQNHIAAMKGESKSSATVARASVRLRRSFYKVALQMTDDRKEAKRLTDQILGIPNKHDTDIIMHTAEAKRRIREARKAFNREMNRIRDEGINIKIKFGGAGTGFKKGINALLSSTGNVKSNALRNARGNVVDYYAAGGVRENHVAQMAPAGSMRVWAEPETGGEAYIPLAQSKRSRSEAILDEVARRFGKSVIPMARGGVVNHKQNTTLHTNATAAIAHFDRFTDALGNRIHHNAQRLGNDLSKSLSAMLFAGGGPAVGGKSLRSWIAQALRITHTPFSWLAPMTGLAMHESGGNPRAVNNWDINAQLGHPSMGLMQTIPSTFNTYGLGGSIFNPVANAIAAIRYIKARYGSIFRIPSYRGGTRFVGGYEEGTPYVPETGMALIHQGEMILPKQVASAVRAGVAATPALAAGAAGPLIGTLVVQTSPNASAGEIVNTAMHAVRVAKRAGAGR